MLYPISKSALKWNKIIDLTACRHSLTQSCNLEGKKKSGLTRQTALYSKNNQLYQSLKIIFPLLSVQLKSASIKNMYHTIQPERVKICCYTQPKLWHCPIFPGFTYQSHNTRFVCLELHVIDTERQVSI